MSGHDWRARVVAPLLMGTLVSFSLQSVAIAAEPEARTLTAAVHWDPAASAWETAVGARMGVAAVAAEAQDAGAIAELNIVVVEGEGAINNVKQRVVRDPIVRVEDRNRKPVAGVAITFTLPNQGASGVFANGARTMTVMTDNQGQAVAQGFRPNAVKGQFKIHVSASHNGQTASTTINQTNAAAVAGAAAGGLSLKLITILAVAGAVAVAGGVYAATNGGGGNTNTVTGPAPIALVPGNPGVGGPH